MNCPNLTPVAGATFRVRYATGYGKPVVAITEYSGFPKERDIAVFPPTQKGIRDAERRCAEINSQSAREMADRLSRMTGKGVL